MGSTDERRFCRSLCCVIVVAVALVCIVIVNMTSLDFITGSFAPGAAKQNSSVPIDRNGASLKPVQLKALQFTKNANSTSLTAEHNFTTLTSGGTNASLSTTVQTRGAIRDTCTAEFQSRHLVRAWIAGRTGNRLFELATLIAAADDACYTAVHNTANIPYMSSIFQHINNVNINKYDVSKFRNIYERGWSIYSGPIWHNLVLTRGFNWSIAGSRQSYKYFQHKKELVRSSFVFKTGIKEDVENLFTKWSFNFKTKVGIHIRRGDFLNKTLIKSGYFASSLRYLNGAVMYFKERIRSKDLVFIVVSDDIQWCLNNIKFPNVYFSPFNDVGKDLYILTQCDHTIMTTGSFGWMGAWLNETGTVVYDKSFPRLGSKLWAGFKAEDYYPHWWIRL